ncbi:RNA-directed DNA polymerase [Photorhabdus laumondii]|uniref:RNA-directed DNA polymerase n=1 Tax=Photorhabdus laumondii TaxID=2218628 RepID=UPI0025AF4DBF|nr:RNA-directed DNA polymerase [Photorhabdus laumondii]
MDKVKELLSVGFLPVQLPPTFSTKEFADNYKKFEDKWIAQKKQPDTKAEKFSVARSSYYRRVTSIVNPISYFFLVKEIADHWSKIERHYRKSNISLSKPKLLPSLRAIDISRFSELYEAKVTKSAGYRYALVTDITSYFPTIYTHSIPWALHGKAAAKQNRRSQELLGNILDSKSIKLQDSQTIGLPIGPDSSHIIAEIIGVAIDKDFHDALGYWPAGFRYVDDYCLFFDKREEAEKALAELTKAVSNYELQINPSKTKIVEVKELVKESWKYSIRKLKISDKKRKQRDDIHNYFEVLFSIEDKFKDESVVKYGLKQISSSIIRKSNWDVFEAYLLKCGYNYPNTLQTIANLLATYNYYKYKLNKDSIERFCHNLIKTHAISNHHGEVSWLLTICNELDIKIKRDVVREVENMNSSICNLLILHMHHSGKKIADLLTNTLKKFANIESLESSSWLLTYEAGKRKWLKNTDTDFIKSHHFFRVLLDHDISFFDPNMRISPIFKLKETKELSDFSLLFDSDEHIESHFEFDDQNEEYFDETHNYEEDGEEDENSEPHFDEPW